MSVEFINTIGYEVFSDDLEKIPLNNSESKVINTISPNSYGIATKDKAFKSALRGTDYLVLDGVYFALASILMNGKNIKANQGPDVFYHFMNRLNETEGKAFFLGSSPQTLDKIKARAAKEYPGITLDTYSPPYKAEFSTAENDAMVAAINTFKPDVVFVGMTCPKQEKWAIQHKVSIQSGLIICIGNVFDWFAGTQRIIHPFWFKIKLGWFVRIIIRPEIFRRNIGNQMKFFWDIFLIFIKLKKYD